MLLASTALEIGLALLGAGVLLFAILGGAALVLRLAEGKYAERAEDENLTNAANPFDASSKDPDWDPVLELKLLTDLSKDRLVLRALYKLFPQDGSIDRVPNVPLMVDTSGAVRFAVPAYCRFLTALAPRIKFAVQAVENPLEFVHGPTSDSFLEYVVAVLFYGGSVGYVLPDRNTIEVFADWKAETVGAALRETIDTDNESTAPRAVDFDDALQRLICLPAPNPLVFDYIQAFIRLSDVLHPPLGFVARQAYGKRQTTSIHSLPPAVAQRNLRHLIHAVQAGIEDLIAQNAHQNAFAVVTMAQWLENAGVCKDKYINHIQSLLREAGASEPDLKAPPSWSPSATLLHQNPFEEHLGEPGGVDGKRAAR